jgi:hypothetical protein
MFTANQIKHGLIMSAVVIICLFLMEITNSTFESKSPLMMFSTMIAPIFVWFSGLYAKKRSQKNKLSFKEGVLESFKISLIFGIISPFIFLFYYLFFNMEAVEYVKAMYNLNTSIPLVIAFDMVFQFIAAVLFGTVYGTIITFFLKSTKK